MPKQAVRTFQGGMVRDLDKSLVTKDRYLEAHNFRLVTSTGPNSTGDSSGSIENIEGNNFITSSIPPGMSVVGNVYLRDTVVLFLTTNTVAPTPGAGRNMVVSFSVNTSTEDLSNYFVHYDDSLNNTTGTLDFSTIYPIRPVAVYESPTIQKVYWADGYNNVRFANIGSYLTTNRAIKSVANYYFHPHMLEFIPNVVLGIPTLDRIVAGDIKAGTVQYAYQYFTQNGGETVMSPLSNTIHITNKNDYESISIKYKGENNINSPAGKGVRINITVTGNTIYNYIRVVRLHYTTINSVPTITVVGEIEMDPTSTNILFTDTGALSYGTLTLDQFNIGETELFSAKDLAIKEQRLFAANISTDEFTLSTWDSRAIRFEYISTQSQIQDSISGVTVINSPAEDTLSGWNSANWASYTETHDGINPFNNPLNDGVAEYMFKFQKDGTTLGAEGPNVKIGFTTDTMVIDSSNTNNGYYVTTESTNDNKSYTSFASPYLSGRRSWQRDEVYRLYLVFFDERGRSSQAKWVCDLRMPSLHDPGFGILATVNGTNVETTALYPTVYLKSLPTGAVSAQLLRVQRGGSDRSVLTQGLVLPVLNLSSFYSPYLPTELIINSPGLVKLVSPEINILNNISLESGDYIEYVTKFPSYIEVGIVERGTIYKLRGNEIVPYESNCKATIEDTKFVVPSSTEFTFGSLPCKNYNSLYSTYCSSGLFIKFNNPIWSAGSKSMVVANYKRDVHASQYGGQTYESRSRNIAIPASGLINAGTLTTAWQGDTFISYFEVSVNLFDLSKTTAGSTHSCVLVPVESSINCELRHDKSMARGEAVGFTSFLMQEVAGVWTNASGSKYNQETSLYQYNTVYSQESTAKYYVNVPYTVSTQTKFDCTVRVSKNKINSESQDSWTQFPINDFIEVNTKHGPITTLASINGRLLFWQSDAFGSLSVNERSLIQDATGSSLVLGTGGILDRYDYVSEKVGVTDNRSLTATQTGVYWANVQDNSVYRFSSELVNLSKSKMFQSFNDTRLAFDTRPTMHIRTVYDTKYNEVLFTIYNSTYSVGTTLCYDENIDAFTSFYDYYTNNFIPFRNGYLSTGDTLSTPHNLYYHNSKLANRCSFYGTLHPSTIKVVFNDDYGYTKVFDNIFWVSNASTLDTTTTTPIDVSVYDNTFNSIRCYNTYQNTDFCGLTYGINLERDERDWTTFVPRNAVNKAYNTDPMIFDALNITKSRTFKERIRDKFMVTDFIYTNADNKRFVVPYIGIKYRISPR